MDGSLLPYLSDGESPPKESSSSLNSHPEVSLPSGLEEEQREKEEEEEEADAEEEEEEEEEVRSEHLLSTEEQVTLITDSMSVTSADEEKLQLLNKNMELRRINKELMKLNEDWDHIYRSTTLSLQQRMEALQREISSIRQLNSKLLLKVEHEQNKGGYYEHTLMEELKKNQHLQEYVQLLEGRMQQSHSATDWSILTPSLVNGSRPTEISTDSKCSPDQKIPVHHLNGHVTTPHPPPSERSGGGGSGGRGKGQSGAGRTREECTLSEVQDLKDQLEALKCQTKIYEADYRTEHKDHERMLQENKRLRRREGEMRQQMALLQEQLKVYEDDFQRERSDKQVLQRLLMKKTPPPAGEREPALVHRCSASSQEPEHAHERERERAREERRRRREAQRDLHHPTCPKHCQRHAVGEFS
ncbi:trichohyalin [Sardina pilchardus]|uniref:trichohyalin n=1 Tax=Sardina pilchardus TaxID=27697 RepID=UPI002E11DCE0